MKILAVRWFCGASNVGIVQVQDPGEGIKYYIGSPPDGRDENSDTQWIADWGSWFPGDVGDQLFGVPQ